MLIYSRKFSHAHAIIRVPELIIFALFSLRCYPNLQVHMAYQNYLTKHSRLSMLTKESLINSKFSIIRIVLLSILLGKFCKVLY